MHQALRIREMRYRDYKCQEKKKEEDSPSWKIAWMHASIRCLKDNVKISKLITAANVSTVNKMVKKTTTKTRK